MLDSEYKLLSSIDEEVEKNHKSVQRSLYDRYIQSFVYSSAPAVISFMLVSNLASILLCLYLLVFSGSESKPGGFEKGFQTDLAAARDQISVRRVMFTGGPTFYDNGTEVLKFPADQPRYVGEPSQDIDDAWNALTRDRYIILTEDEAREAWGPEYTEFWDEDKQAYLAGLESFHLLHCLDHLRQSFYPDHYTHTGIHGALHRDHCIDALRQMLQCVVDVTPIPTRYYPGIGHNYIDSDREHTCRDFDQMRVWMSHRTATTVPQ